MEFGAAIFFTDYAMGPVELGLELEARGFESFWVPEHSHIPPSPCWTDARGSCGRRAPDGGEKPG